MDPIACSIQGSGQAAAHSQEARWLYYPGSRRPSCSQPVFTRRPCRGRMCFSRRCFRRTGQRGKSHLLPIPHSPSRPCKRATCPSARINKPLPKTPSPSPTQQANPRLPMALPLVLITHVHTLPTLYMCTNTVQSSLAQSQPLTHTHTHPGPVYK